MKKRLVAIILLTLSLSTGCEFKITTARLSNVNVCSSYDGKHGCLEDYTLFTSLPDTIFVSSKLSNAPKNTEIRFYWYQLVEGEEILIDSLQYFNAYNTELIHAHFTTDGKPLGSYKVIARVIADNQKAIEKTYELAFPDHTAIHMSRIGNARNEDSKRVTQLTRNFSYSDDAVYFSANVYNLIPHSNISIYYVHVDSGETIDEIHLTAGEEPDEVSLLNSNLPITADLKSGNYRIFVQTDEIKKSFDFFLTD
jgi:hypothetical protein